MPNLERSNTFMGYGTVHFLKIKFLKIIASHNSSEDYTFISIKKADFISNV